MDPQTKKHLRDVLAKMDSPEKNEFSHSLAPSADVGAAGSMVINRQAQEVQAAMVIAKNFPRDEAMAFDKIMRACTRKGLAEQSQYTYPRGKERVSGPSIRLAESIAQNWGNVDYGIIEIENSGGKSEMMAYAWDLETNTRVTKIFSVKHRRDTKSGGYDLTDSRDIYEATANFGARRVRACILGVVPGDVVDAAVKRCNETLAGEHKSPIQDRIRKMLATFESEFLVSAQQVADYLGHSVDAISEPELVRLAGVYRSLRDGMATPRDFFPPVVREPEFKDAEPKAPPAKTPKEPEEGKTAWELQFPEEGEK